jgi:hypothetical protein
MNNIIAFASFFIRCDYEYDKKLPLATMRKCTRQYMRNFAGKAATKLLAGERWQPCFFYKLAKVITFLEQSYEH